MRAKEFTTEKRKPREPEAGDITPHDYMPGWTSLNYLKERAQNRGRIMEGSYQLFVPRRNPGAITARDKRFSNLSNAYAWDDEGNLKPNYAKWEEPRKELSGLEVQEAAPILTPGKVLSPPGNSKPKASLWTSTAREGPNAWSSEWARWTWSNQSKWFSETGYLYKVKPGALVLELNSDHDAEMVYDAFTDLGRAKERDVDSYEKWELHREFPWGEISKHFDAVWHGGYGRDGDDFMYGWDVESTAWFDTSFLVLVGEVPVVPYSDDE